MRTSAIVLGFLASAVANIASAATTKDFLFRCAQDERRCAAQIKEVARVIERPPPGQRAPVRICFPAGLSDEGLVGEVTYWIDSQMPSWDNKDEFDSIAAALTALYACDRGGLGDYP